VLSITGSHVDMLRVGRSRNLDLLNEGEGATWLYRQVSSLERARTDRTPPFQKFVTVIGLYVILGNSSE
jgi:hypothetical protein